MSKNIQPDNRNYLSPIGFKFVLEHAPKVDFMCNTANIPDINLGVANQPNYMKMLDVPGDVLTYGDLNITFLVDEDLENYIEIHNWLRGLGFPEKISEFEDFQNEHRTERFNGAFPELSDGKLIVLNSNYRTQFEVRFKGLFPYSLSTLQFDCRDRDYNYFTASATFKYTIFNITDRLGNKL